MSAELKSRAGLLVLLCFGLLLGGCQDSLKAANADAQAAQAALEAGDYDLASEKIAKAIARRDDVPEYFLLRGAIELSAGKTRSAFGAYAQALALDQTNRIALVNMANLGTQIGALSDAEKAADTLLALEPDMIAALQIKAVIAMWKSRDEEAMEIAKRISSINPGNETAALIQARIIARKGEYEEALAVLDKAVTSNGATVPLLSLKLNIYRAQGNAAGMAEIFPELIGMARESTELPLDYAYFLYKTGRPEQARSIIVALLRRKLTDPAPYKDAVRIWAEYDTAPLNGADRRLLANDASIPVLQTVIRHLLLSGDLKQASLIVESANARRGAEQLRALAGRIMLRLGQSERPAAIADRILKDDPGNIDALLLRSELSLKAGRADSAIIDAQRAVSEDPVNPDAYMVLARSFEKQGQSWRAKQIWEEALTKMPQSQYLLAGFLQFLHKNGEEERAIGVARAFSLASPASVKGWAIYARECRSSGASCSSEAEAGLVRASTLYALDAPPGATWGGGITGRLQEVKR